VGTVEDEVEAEEERGRAHCNLGGGAGGAKQAGVDYTLNRLCVW